MEFLLADEPTSDLDAVSQARFLHLLMELVELHDLADQRSEQHH